MSKQSIIIACALALVGAASAYASIPDTVSVPEPATGLLLVTGAGACWAAFRRKKKD